MNKPNIYADFNNADAQGRLRLNCQGTFDDLAQQGIELVEGMPIVLHDEELEAEGRAHFSADEQIWVVSIDWGMVRQKEV